MRKINLLLLTFLGIVFVIALSGWYFIQSKDFARRISRTLTTITEKELNAKISFTRLQINLFPPGFVVDHVKLKHTSESVDVELDLGEVGVYFDIIGLPRSKITVDEIKLEKGYASIKIKESSDNEPKQLVYPLVEKALRELPFFLYKITVNDTLVVVDDVKARVQNLTIQNNEDHFLFNILSGLTEIPGWSLYPIDQFEARGRINQNDIDLSSFTFFSEVNKLEGDGLILNYENLDKILFKGNVNAELFLGSLNRIKEIQELEVQNGVGFLKSKVQLDKDGIRSQFDLNIQDFDSKIVDANLVNAKGRIENNKIYLSEAKLENETQKGQLLKEVEIIDLKSLKHLKEAFYLEIENIKLSNVLQVLGEPLRPLKGELSGKIKILVNGKDLYFIPDDGFIINDLGLVFDDKDGKKFNILKTSKFATQKAEFKLLNNQFYFDTQLKSKKSHLFLSGVVGKKGVEARIAPSNISLEELGDIAGMGLKGYGSNEVIITGPLDHVLMEMKGDFVDFEFLEFPLGFVSHELKLDLKRKEIILSDIKAKKGPYKYNGSGSINFEKELIEIDIVIPLISYERFKDILHPFRDGFDVLPKDFDGDFSGNIHIESKGEVKKNIQVAADVEVKRISAYEETIDEARFEFIYFDRRLLFENLIAKKDGGKFKADLNVEIDKKLSHFIISTENLSSRSINLVRDLPIEMEFNSTGNIEGYLSPTLLDLSGEVKMQETNVRNQEIQDSHLRFIWNKERRSLNGNLFGDWIKITMPKEKNKNVMTGVIDLNVDDLPLLLTALIGENPRLINSEGFLKADIGFDIPFDDFHRSTLMFGLKELSLASLDLKLDHKSDIPQITINSGKVENWSLDLNGSGIDFSSYATGDFTKRVSIENNLKFDTRFAEFFTKYLKRGQGTIDSSLSISYTPNSADWNGFFKTNNVSITSDYLPFSINQLNLNSKIKNNTIQILETTFRPENGLVRLSGEIIFDDYYPDVNINYKLEQATFPLKVKSLLTLTGQGMVFGNQKPYLINGNILVNKARVINEFSDWMEQESNIEKIKYLPKNKEHPFLGLTRLDLKIDTENPIVVTNSMVDVSLSGDVHMTGDMFKPLLDGRSSLVGTNSRVFFKNNDYLLTRGEFYFTSRRPMSQPDFDIIAQSTINNYKITTRAQGTPDSFNFDLSSDPSLPKNSILSLIAFGYTEDMSQQISTEDRDRLTNVGVGSFIFDQFKVTDILKKQFGLQVNLGTEMAQQNQSMLQGATQDSLSARTRSATKIEVKKRLSESVNLSVSSTVGGGIGQSQSMNINYGVSKHLQLEGVYELRTNEEGAEDRIDNSIGGDVKLRWSFK